MRKLISFIIIVLALIVFSLITNTNSHETLGDILEEIEEEHGEIVSMILLEGEDEITKPRKLDREQYGIVGESLTQFIDNTSELEVEIYKGTEMEVLYTFVTHTINSEDQIVHLRGFISETGFSFNNDEFYYLKEPKRFQEIVDNYIDQYPY